MRFIIKIILLISPLSLFAQNADSVKKVVPKEKKSFIPTGIRVGIDAVSLIRTSIGKDFSGYEFNADVDFYRYYLTTEIGHWERNFATDEEQYRNDGNYFRIGADINFLLKDPDKNMFFFGMRYAKSSYSEYLTLTTEDAVWGPSTTNYSNENLHATWGEFTTGLRVKMWKFFWMGYTARLKFRLRTDAPEELISYDVPGYGKVGQDNTTWGFNYQILFRIPFKKEKAIKKEDPGKAD
ncbi:MAG TPA: DUF6048 family protein [Cyclobacteriaceae bacterium]|nr:DUF6048 family protein [Cyclobacteriaceae bacterium]